MTKYIITSLALVGVVAAVGAISSSATVFGGVGNSGNGDKSVNTVLNTNTNKVKVNQFNSAFQMNNVGNDVNSGGNTASKNTGAVGGFSDPSINTSSAKAGVGIANTANHNAAAVANCGCDNGVVSAGNTGNGNKSVNTVVVTNTDKTKVNQTNVAVQVNNVSNNVNSGNNKANSNTGGDVNINTGNAESSTVINNSANSNEAVVGGGLVF